MGFQSHPACWFSASAQHGMRGAQSFTPNLGDMAVLEIQQHFSSHLSPSTAPPCFAIRESRGIKVGKALQDH